MTPASADGFYDAGALVSIAYQLGLGFHGTGPALIVEYGSSTLVGPRDTFTIGTLGEIDIDCNH